MAQKGPAGAPPALDLEIGKVYDGFKVQSIQPFNEFNLVTYEMEHERTGAKFVHVSRDDSEKAFCVTFRTRPNNSTGVAHVLEHTVLCGSERYPVRDPFFLLLRRSLQTYMNALTASDHTMYPFSTVNEQDYKNLLGVYLDATFFPKLNETDFWQEGHRLEFSEQSNPDTPLEFKGVVFNEMKGAMGDSSSVFMQAIQSALFKHTTYHVNSGGDPAEITNLTYEELRAFHQDSYHPSNACFFSYGDIPPPLAVVDELVLQRFNREDVDLLAPIFPEPSREEPAVIRTTGPPDPLSEPTKQTKVATAWLCQPFPAEMSEEEVELEKLGLQLLGFLLLDGPLAPMYKALLDTNICNGYAPCTGIDTSFPQPVLSFGAQGIVEQDVDKVITIVRETLERAAVEGFQSSRIDAVMHQIEIDVKRVQTRFGVSLLQRLSGAFAKEQAVAAPLRKMQLVNQLQEKLAEGPYLEGLLRRHILDNPHSVTLIMNPDAGFSEKELVVEKEKLANIQASLAEGDKARIVGNATALKLAQEQEPDVDCLPSLAKGDIVKEAEPFHSTSTEVVGKSVMWVPQPTNGLAYIRGLVDASRLPDDLQIYVPLFISFLFHMGAGNRDYRALSHDMELHTAGMGMDFMTYHPKGDLDNFASVVRFSGSSLERKVPQLFELYRDVLSAPRFDDLDRLLNLIIRSAGSASSSLQDSGVSFALSRSTAHVLPSAALTDVHGGVPFVAFLNELLAKLCPEPNDPSKVNRELLQMVSNQLWRVGQHLLADGWDRCMAVGDEQSLQSIETHLPQLLQGGQLTRNDDSQTAGSKFETLNVNPSLVSTGSELKNTFFSMPLSVNNVALSVRTVPMEHPDSAKLLVLGQALSAEFLHTEIREVGGAYGGGAGQRDGAFSFHSYQDPNVLSTVSAFHRAGQWAIDGNIKDRHVEEALLSTFAQVDAPRAPSSKGMVQFVQGRTQEQRQRYRDQLLATTKEDLVDVARRYISPGRLTDQGAVCVVGGKEGVAKIENDPEWNIIPL